MAICKSFNIFKVCVPVQKEVLPSARFATGILVRTKIDFLKVRKITTKQGLSLAEQQREYLFFCSII